MNLQNPHFGPELVEAGFGRYPGRVTVWALHSLPYLVAVRFRYRINSLRKAGLTIPGNVQLLLAWSVSGRRILHDATRIRVHIGLHSKCMKRAKRPLDGGIVKRLKKTAPLPDVSPLARPDE